MFYEHKGRYGYPRIAQQLYDEGIETNKRVVAVLMRGMNLCAKGFHRSIKRELIEPNKHKSEIEMKVLIQDYLEDYYSNAEL